MEACIEDEAEDVECGGVVCLGGADDGAEGGVGLRAPHAVRKAVGDLAEYNCWGAGAARRCCRYLRDKSAVG